MKSAIDLGLTPEQFNALEKTLEAMESGQMRHVPDADTSFFNFGNEHKFSGQFNMNIWREGNKCGTVACIGGTAEILGGIVFDESTIPENLVRLFYPQDNARDYASITVAQAARALRNYLETGAARWDEVLR